MLLTITAFCLAAFGHVGAPVDAIDVDTVGTNGRALEASIGLIWSEAGTDWRWVCHEAITSPDAVVVPHYAFAGRRWLATVPRLNETPDGAEAVRWTDDGCTWTVSTGLTGHEIPEVALAPAGDIALAITGDELSETVDANAILRSTDGGASFDAVLTVPGMRFTSVVIAEGTAQTAVVGGLASDGQGWVYWSRDTGATWTGAAVIEGEVRAMALHPTDPDVGYAVLDGVGVETLLRLTDGGATATIVSDPDGQISDVEVAEDGGVWMAFAGQAFLYAADGIHFSLVTAAPPGLGLALDGDHVVLATRFELVNEALVEGNPADGFVPTFSFFSMDGPLECPAGTGGADVCAPLYSVLESKLGLDWDTGDTTDPAPDPDDTDGGSDAPADPTADAGTAKDEGCGSGAWLILPFGLWGAGVRRRRPAHH